MTRILVVDDEEDIRQIVEKMLDEEGYDVLTAGNSGEALTLAEEEHPDMILMDVVMRGRNGFDTCKILKFKPATKDIPLVMFSALNMDVDKEMADKAGADGYIAKPFDKQIIETIEKYLK